MAQVSLQVEWQPSAGLQPFSLTTATGAELYAEVAAFLSTADAPIEADGIALFLELEPIPSDDTALPAPLLSGDATTILRCELAGLSSVVEPTDVSNGLIVMGADLPGNVADVEPEVVRHFASFGNLKRVLVQAREAAEDSAKTIVALYTDPASLQAALASAEHSIRGVVVAPVALVQAFAHGAAAAPAEDGEEDKAAEEEEAEETVAARANKRVTQMLAGLLATGYVVGQRGVTAVRHVDEQRGISERALQMYQVIDDKYAVGATVRGVYLAVATKAEQLGVEAALKSAVEKVMSNPYVAEGTTRLAAFGQSVWSAASERIAAATAPAASKAEAES